MTQTTDVYTPRHSIRLITAASLFDGHDASINIMRRILQRSGAEVVHLGHNRSVAEIVKAAIEEDAQGIAITSYQGGHNEFFKYMVDLLRQRGYGHVKVFGGGGGVILPDEIRELQDYGVTRIYTPEDGRMMGLQGMINDLLGHCDFDPAIVAGIPEIGTTTPISRDSLLRCMSSSGQNGSAPESARKAVEKISSLPEIDIPVVGITGTGGAGKSSLTDELILRLRGAFPDRRVLVMCIDPTLRRTGGALLGDRIRMNAIEDEHIIMRSLATRQGGQDFSASVTEALTVAKRSDADLILLETPGIGQGDTAVADVSDVTLYVMTSEFGAPTQLEKISMLDYADLVAINKFERQGSLDAYRDVCRQIRRNKGLPSVGEADNVFGTCASRFNDPGVTTLFRALMKRLDAVDKRHDWDAGEIDAHTHDPDQALIPSDRQRYLSDIAREVRDYKAWADRQARLVSDIATLERAANADLASSESLHKTANALRAELHPEVQKIWSGLDEFKDAWSGDEFVYEVRGREIRQPLTTTSLSGLSIPRIGVPNYWDPGRLVLWRLLENMPGEFPYTAGVFPLKRTGEDPARMFAGEGDPARTNRRFHLVSEGQPASRLSTAFDSVTLYGEDPDERPDIWGKVGESGVSICTIENMERLYAGFDLCAPTTSVSMTINGPAPMMLAFFLNAATRQQCRLHLIREGRLDLPEEQAYHPDEGERRWEDVRALLSDEEYEKILGETVRVVRGTVQADILKEDQAQNTCIFSTEFALKLMSDIQEWFIEHEVRNYYSVSISGYHIAEAGANPVTQAAFTLSNGFTYVESYRARGLSVDDVAPNLSFFFSNGLDPEYQVIGRVARRIWAVAMKRVYGANDRSQKLKYHIQTSGRSLHAQEIDFNDIRTTLQALMAIYDNCNSLHTNAYDEAITTPTEESVRRALAIQMIINREFGGTRCENPLQGAFIIEELTDLVEEAVLAEFDRLTLRGGVLGAMETQYQRTKIQEESLHYEHLKHTGELPVIGVNTFLNPRGGMASDQGDLEVARATLDEKQGQLDHVRAFQGRHADMAEHWKQQLRETARANGNVFAVMMDAVNHLSLGQITQTLFQVGGKYRRNL